MNEDAPVSRPVQRIGIINSRSILGGLHHQCARVRFLVHTTRAAAMTSPRSVRWSDPFPATALPNAIRPAIKQIGPAVVVTTSRTSTTAASPARTTSPRSAGIIQSTTQRRRLDAFPRIQAVARQHVHNQSGSLGVRHEQRPRARDDAQLHAEVEVANRSLRKQHAVARWQAGRFGEYRV